MRYTSGTLSDSRDAVRELVFRPIYPGHAMGWDHTMLTHRIATAAVLLALFSAACASHDGTDVATGPATAVVESTTTTSTALPPDTTPDTLAPAAVQPVVKPAARPEPATIEVDYQPHDGATATATITGPNGSHSRSLDSGAALFGGLPAGTYSVTITVDTPSGDPSVGDARQIINGNSVHVEPGDHGVITCDDNGCSGAL